MKTPAALTLAWALAVAAQAQPGLLPGDTGPSATAGDQAQPAIARGSHSLLAVWSDTRSNPYGTSDYETGRDLYGARLDAAGHLLDPVPFPICVAPAAQDYPQVAWNGALWLVVFETISPNGTGYYHKTLAAVRVAPTGQVLDASPIPLHGLTPANYGTWAVASDGTNWVVVNQGTSTSGDIVAVRISPAGAVLDPPNRAIVKATYYLRSNIRLAHAGGVFLCTFNDDADTKCVRFDSSLNLLGAPATLLTDSLHDLASNGSGFYGIWTRQNADFSLSLAGSRISTTGTRLDGNGVNLSGSRQPYGINHSVTWDGVNWRVLWGEFATAYVARVNASGNLLSPGSVAVPGILPGPLAGLGGTAQAVWTAYTNNNNDVFTANLSGSSTLTGLRALSIGAPLQWRPDVASSGNGWMIVYLSSTAASHRVLAQALDAAGHPLTPEPVALAQLPRIPVPVAIDSAGPSVAWNGAVYLVTWGTTNAVVGQRLLADGTKLDPVPFTILTNAFGPTDVAAVGDIFLVTSRRYGFTPQNIFAYGTRVRGSDAAVLDTLGLGGTFVSRPPVVTALGDRFFVAFISNWTHNNPGADTIGVFVPVSGTAISQQGIYQFSTAGGNFIFELGLAANDTTALLVQPAEITSGVENDLIGWIISSTGTVSPMINFTPWPGNQYRPRVAWDGAQFLLAYQDQKNRLAPNALDALDARCDIYAMRVSPTGVKIDPQGFALSTSPVGETDPAVASHNGVTLFAWAQMIHNTNFANYRIVTRRFDGSMNQWPVAVASANPLTGDVSLTVQFSAAGSTDPDGAVIAYFWEFGDGTSSTLANPTRTFASPGNYPVKLTVTDNLGATAAQTLIVQATAPNLNPVAIARAVPQSGPPPLNVTLYADGSYDPDGVIGNIEWLSPDGGTYWGSPAYFTFNTAGQRLVTLRVYDDRGAIGTTNILINVGGPNQRPVAVITASPTNGPAPLCVNFNGSASYDTDGQVVSYAWTFGDGGTADYANPTHCYAASGNYTARLVVTDNAGGKGTNTVVISVGASNRPPVAVVSANPTRGTAPLTVNFSSAGSSDPDGSIVSYAWNFGDGGTSTQPNPVYTYLNRGTFLARLTVTDNRGAAASQSVTITVRQPPKLANARVNLPGTFAFDLEGETNTTYILQASSDGVHWTNIMTLPSPDMPAPLTLPAGTNRMLLWRAVMQ